MNKNPKQRFDVDPILKKISPHIPDEEIDFLFPYRNFNKQGRSKSFKTSQLYRAHILTLIKELHHSIKFVVNLNSEGPFGIFVVLKIRIQHLQIEFYPSSGDA